MIDEILDQISLGKVSFILEQASKSKLVFKTNCKVALPEPKNKFEELVLSLTRGRITPSKGDDRVVKLRLHRDDIKSAVKNHIQSFLIANWMLVNQKKQWRRTQLYKDISNINDSTKEVMLQLYLDAIEYGVNTETLSENTEIKPIHKFLAAKFQAAVEAACRR